MAKPLPYQEEIEYTRALDDADGNSFWRPSLLQFFNVTFYLQMEKCGKSKQWYFYVQVIILLLFLAPSCFLRWREARLSARSLNAKCLCANMLTLSDTPSLIMER